MTKLIDLLKYKKEKANKFNMLFDYEDEEYDDEDEYYEDNICNTSTYSKHNLFKNIQILLLTSSMFSIVGFFTSYNNEHFNLFMISLLIYIGMFIILYLCYNFRYIGIDIKTNIFNTILLLISAFVLCTKFNKGAIALLYMIHSIVTIVFMCVCIEDIQKERGD